MAESKTQKRNKEDAGADGKGKRKKPNDDKGKEEGSEEAKLPAAKDAKEFFSRLGVMGLDQLKIDAIMANIDKAQFRQMTINFPLDQDLTLDLTQVQEDTVPIDHRFILSLLFHLVSPQNLIICLQFIQCKCLAFSIASLSSNCEDVRRLGYAILARFYQHLESSTHYKNRELWISFLDLLRASLKENNEQIPRVVTNFLSEAIDALLDPRNFMYDTIREFVTRVSSFDAAAIMGLLLSLQKSVDDKSSLNFSQFSLRCLANGAQTELDIQLYQKHKVFDRLLPQTQSPLTDQDIRVSIYKVIESTVKFESAVVILCRSYGLMTWLTQECCLLKKQSVRKEVRTHFSDIVTQLSSTVLTMTKDEKKLLANESLIAQLTIVLNLL